MTRRFLLFSTAILLVVSSLLAPAQKFQPKTIQFKGYPEYSDQELMSAAGLKKGEILDYADMNSHSKQLMDSGVLEGLSFKFDGVDLVFSLKPSSLLFPVRFENLPITADKELDAKLHDRFPLYHGKVPSEGGLLDNVRGALEEMLAAQGIKATITATPYSDLKLQKVTAMSLAITEPSVEIGEIHLENANAVLDPKAKEILSKQTGSAYNLEGSASQIETNLGNYFRDKGYLEVKIHAVPQSAPVITLEAIRIPSLVSVSPGALYKLKEIHLAPGLLVTQADFDQQSHIHSGDIANSQYVRENWQFIERQYHNKGYLKAVVHPTPSFDHAQGTASFSITVEPGPVYIMGKLKIENVSDDLRAAILAVWGMPSGTTFNEGSIRGFFATVGVHPALERVFATVNFSYLLHPNDDTHTVDLDLTLEKKH